MSFRECDEGLTLQRQRVFQQPGLVARFQQAAKIVVDSLLTSTHTFYLLRQAGAACCFV
jgi:hypothetical protein